MNENKINCGAMYEPEWPKSPKIDRTVDKPFCVQAHDIHGMFSFVACSVPDKNNKGGNE